MLAYKDGRNVRLESRNGKDHSRRFPELAVAVAALPGRTLVLDVLMPRLGDRDALAAVQESKSFDQWRDLQVVKCFRFFLREFKKRSEADPAATLPRLTRDVTARMGLVVITVAGENPYEIFESLNSTGLPLKQSDLIRNYIFMKVPLEGQQAFYDDHWRPFEERFQAVGADSALDATAFYRNYLLREGTYLAARDTYVDFRDGDARRDLSPQAQVVELRRFLEFQLWVLRPSSCPDPRIRACLLELSRLDVATSHPLILVLLSGVEDRSLSLDVFRS